jgi:uncharacterized membrane protein YccC
VWQLGIACLLGLMFVVVDRLWELFDHDGMWILVTIAVCTESSAGASLRKGILRLWGAYV